MSFIGCTYVDNSHSYTKLGGSCLHLDSISLIEETFSSIKKFRIDR